MFKALAIVAIVVALSWGFRAFWVSPPESFFKPAVTTADVPKADIYMQNTDTRQFNAQGQLAYRLTSERSEHFPDSKRFDLQNPRVTSFQQDQPPWTLSANNGTATQGDEAIRLTNNVVGRHFLQQRTITLNTEALAFNPSKRVAESEKTVTITMPDAKTSGTGFRANLETGEFRLLSRVTGQMDAPAEVTDNNENSNAEQ